MVMRSSSSMMTLSHSVTLSGNPDEPSAGRGEVPVENECLRGPDFSTYATARGEGGSVGRAQVRPIIERDPRRVLSLDRVLMQSNNFRGAVHSPQEDLK